MRTLFFWWRLLPLLCLPLALEAQQLDGDGINAADRALVDTRMKRLLVDGRLNSGFLLDYGLGLVDLPSYRQAEPVPDSVCASAQIWRSAYASLASARLGK